MENVNVMSKFEIDFFEFAFLVEACLPPVPIARMMFFQNVLTIYYEQMSVKERARLHGWILKNPRFDLNEKYHKAFDARYNPDNQYLVIGIDDKKYNCFLVDDKYYSLYLPESKSAWIPKENIKSITKIEYHG
jgi:hypothetical protein